MLSFVDKVAAKQKTDFFFPQVGQRGCDIGGRRVGPLGLSFKDSMLQQWIPFVKEKKNRFGQPFSFAPFGNISNSRGFCDDPSKGEQETPKRQLVVRSTPLSPHPGRRRLVIEEEEEEEGGPQEKEGYVVTYVDEKQQL